VLVGEPLPVAHQRRKLAGGGGTNSAFSIVDVAAPIQLWLVRSRPGVRSRPRTPAIDTAVDLSKQARAERHAPEPR
jgi:hypothetical protein